MRRREFIALIGVAAWPLSARGQQGEQVRRIAVLMNLAADDREGQARIAAFQQGLQQSGWIEGRNVHLDIRWAAGDAARFRAYASELVALAPDAILAASGSAMPALLQATRSIPIVFVQVVDPVGNGYVASLARPGGNATGFTNLEFGMSGKWLELLRQIAPRVTHAAVLRDIAEPNGMGQWGALQSVAPSMGLELSDRRAGRGRDRARRDGIRAQPERRIGRYRKRADSGSSRSHRHTGGPAQFARGLRLPLSRASGGLISYGPKPSIRTGAPPAMSTASSRARSRRPPVQAPTKYELVINLKTAKALGLKCPHAARPRRRGDRMSGASSSRCSAARRPLGRSRRARSSRTECGGSAC